MMSESTFQNAAIASGLLSRQQIDDALHGLVGATTQGPQTIAEVLDSELASRVVELGYLNRWQAEQLKEGRTKFTLGPYKIVNAIGRGGMGHVFKAEHKFLGRIEAVKVLPKGRSTPDAIAAFQREIRAQAQLDHPNLVRASYADHEGDTYFFVTEYVPGTDLRKLVRRNGPLSAAIAATIIAQVAEGLHYAHRKGLVHRDVKPGNVLVTPEGRAKITDLGLAWCVMDDLEGVGEAPKTLVGTVDYMAPETIREPDKICPVSDVYALGCTLYYAVTGKVPYPGGNTNEKMTRHLMEAPLNPLHFNPDLPEEFCDVIAAMMDKNPDTRMPTAIAVAEALAPWCDPLATQALAEQAPPPSGILQRGGSMRALTPSPAQLSETAEFVLDDDELSPSPIDSPSQISQGTVPISAESEDTLPHERHARVETLPSKPTANRLWFWIGGAIAMLAILAAFIAAML